MSATPRSKRTASGWNRRRVGLGIALFSALGLLVWSRWPEPPTADGDPFPLPEISASPFLNTQPAAHYVGSDACFACHSTHDMSFRRTGMGRSMGEVDPDQEPPDGSYDHPLSKRRYEIRRKNDKLWHREFLLTKGGDEVLLQEFPLKYVVGSGRHSRTYLAEADGFLVESPVTWYTSRKAWDMSPGYDWAEQEGFQRPVEENCLFCHAGRVEALGGTLHRIRVLEATISCERCHGPGSLHVAHHQAATAPLAENGIDYTIVNPVHLSRDLAEAVCQQCHLQSEAQALVRGRKLTDFRPGLPLQDFRHDYRLETPDAAMTVTGHVEQLHLSRCYQGSATLTCTTCHDPHAGKPQPGKLTLEHAACLQCHQPAHCTVDTAVRIKESPDNRCTQCHMPRSPTEIPHLAFTHHRIGIHRQPAGGVEHPTGPLELKPVLDLSRFGAGDQQRSLGLAYLYLGHKQRSPDLATPYLRRALDLLTPLREQGMRDPLLQASLDVARFLVTRSAPQDPLPEEGTLSVADRCVLLYVHGYSDVQRGRVAAALPAFEELTRLRRNSIDWLLLAGCRQATGNEKGGIAALEQAVRIQPRLWQAHGQLADIYRRRGDKGMAVFHERRAVP